jgi:hypothetical protein
LAHPGELPHGKSAALRPTLGKPVIVMNGKQASPQLPGDLSRLSYALLLDGTCRREPPAASGQNRLTEFRLERVPQYRLPDQWIVAAITQRGSWLWIASDDHCTSRLQTDINTVLARFVIEQPLFYCATPPATSHRA